MESILGYFEKLLEYEGIRYEKGKDTFNEYIKYPISYIKVDGDYYFEEDLYVIKDFLPINHKFVSIWNNEEEYEYIGDIFPDLMKREVSIGEVLKIRKEISGYNFYTNLDKDIVDEYYQQLVTVFGEDIDLVGIPLSNVSERLSINIKNAFKKKYGKDLIYRWKDASKTKYDIYYIDYMNLNPDDMILVMYKSCLLKGKCYLVYTELDKVVLNDIIEKYFNLVYIDVEDVYEVKIK